MTSAHINLAPKSTRILLCARTSGILFALPIRLGLGRFAELGDAESTKEFARQSLEIDGENPATLYNVACGYALIGESERAMDCLDKAIMRGMAIAGWAENDSDLASLRCSTRFQELISRLKQKDDYAGETTLEP